MRKILVLDAMGVIYKSGDDVGELLIPFIQSKGSQVAEEVIEDAYMQASLGVITAKEFWKKVNLSDEIEDQYLMKHEITFGLYEFLKKV